MRNEYDPASVMIGQHLRILRKDMGLTLREVGDRIGLSAQATGHYETGRSPIDSRRLGMLAQVFHVSIATIVTGTGLPDPCAPFQMAPQNALEPIREPIVEHSDQCDTFNPQVMCNGCRTILDEVSVG